MKQKLPLHLKIIIGLLLGVGWALLSSYAGWNGFTRDWIDPFGEIFIRLLKLIAIPLVLFSIVSGVASLQDVGRLGRTGGKTLVMYIFTTMAAVTIGLALVNAIGPGTFRSQDEITRNRIQYELWAEQTGTPLKDDRRALADPANAAVVAAERAKLDSGGDDRVARLQATHEQTKDQGPLYPLVDAVPANIVGAMSGGEMLQVIFFALLFGITIVTLSRARVAPLLGLVDAVNDVFVRMVELIMRAAPVFVFALMAGVMSKVASTPSEVLSIFQSLGWYALTVVLGLVLVLGVVYPGLLLVLVRKISYREFFRRMSPAQFLAFSTSSSAATLPVTMECVEDRLGVSNKLASFILPIGATVNMDGTALYQAVAVIFLAQMHGVDLTLGQQLGIIITATLASIGAAAVPSAGLVTLMAVLSSVDLNPAWIALILPIDRILDMCRTVVNVTGDATVCAIIASSEGELSYPPKERAPAMLPGADTPDAAPPAS